MATFRKVRFDVKRGNGYGQYIIESLYRGKLVTVHITDSEVYDWINDDSNKEKHHKALRYCYSKIVEAYNNL